MKTVIISSLAALALSATAYAETMTLYTDPSTGEVFTKPAEGRVEMGDFISAKEVYLENQAQDSAIAEKESNDESVSVFAKSSKLEFSGTHYLGYTYLNNKELSVASDPTADKAERQTGNFEFRRNYVQVKAFFFEDPKSYVRVTLDTTYDATNGLASAGYANMYVKYAYIYLNNILPYTGVEFGMAHRPWIDYEEHNAWWYRSISKTMVESAQAADLTNSADAGVNFKTKLPYFTSEIGLFNGEGYHGTQGVHDRIGTGNSVEWRFTAAVLGDGQEKRSATKNTYLDASFFGQYNMLNDGNEMNGTAQTYAFYGFHAVYNMPSFLISAQYITADNDNTTTYKKSGSGYSVNGTYRFGDSYQFEVLARYDSWTAKMDNNPDLETENYIYGAAWRQNKNLKWLLTGETYVAKDKKNYGGSYIQDFNEAMLTAEVSW